MAEISEKLARRRAQTVMRVLTHLAHHEGHAGVSTFDGGHGGATWSISNYLERSGLTFKRSDVEEDEFFRALVALQTTSPYRTDQPKRKARGRK